MGTAIAGAAVVAAAVLAVRSLFRKKGGYSCGQQCSHCVMQCGSDCQSD